MATKSSIHIKPCNIASSEAHNRRTAEYMRNIGESRIYVVPELSTDNEQWINPDFGTPELRTHYDNIKQMVKEKTGRAMQEKERERKGKNGKIIKVAGCSPIREGVLLIRPDTTLADVRKFGEECQRRWGITPLQIFLHKDEGHWLNGQPEAEDGIRDDVESRGLGVVYKRQGISLFPENPRHLPKQKKSQALSKMKKENRSSARMLWRRGRRMVLLPI